MANKYAHIQTSGGKHKAQYGTWVREGGIEIP